MRAIKRRAPTDSHGQYCGWNNTATNASQADLINYPYLYYINPLSPLTTDAVCVATCPNVSAIADISTAICDTNVTTPLNTASLLSAVTAGTCTAFLYQSQIVLNRCLPTVNLTAAIWDAAASQYSIQLGGTNISLSALVSTGRDDFVLAVADVVKTWPYILGGAGVALLASFVFLCSDGRHLGASHFYNELCKTVKILRK